MAKQAKKKNYCNISNSPIEPLYFTIFSLKHLQKFPLLTSGFLLHYLLNDFVFLAFNLVIDIFLVRLVRQDLRMKVVFSLNSHNPDDPRAKKVLSDVKKIEKNTNKMIVYTLLLYLLCRMPELAFSIHLLFVNKKYMGVLYYEMCPGTICIVMSNIIQYIYMISYFTNILFYYKFNKPFRHSLQNLLRLK